MINRLKKKNIIALVDMNAFLASVEESINPHFRGRPLIVGGKHDERGIVICANYVARSKGVKFGTVLSEAYKMTPDAIFLRGNSHVYQDFWDRICDIFHDFTPLVEIVSMDEAYLDLTGCIHNIDSLHSYMSELKARITGSTGIKCSIGVGSSKTIAKIASNMEKPDGLVIIPSGGEKRFLAPLPIKLLPGVGFKTVKVLHDFGVEKIGDILKIPKKLIEDKFGIRGSDFYKCACGFDPRDVKKRGNPKTITRETSFHEDVIDKEQIYAHLYYLLERACSAIRKSKLKALNGRIKLRFSDFGFDELPFRFEKSSNVEGELFEEFKAQYRKLHKRRAALRLVGVSLFRFTPDIEQSNLFAGESERLYDVSKSLDNIRERFGYHSVVNGKTLPLSDIYQKRQYGYELLTSSLTK